MIRGAVLLAVLLAACTPAESPSASVVAPPPDTTATSTEPAATQAPSEPAAIEAPVTITGSGGENSAPFHLNGGTYLVEWTATPDSDQGCTLSANLEAADTAEFKPLANAIQPGAYPMSDTRQIDGLAGGDYYVDSFSGCDWSFTFTAQ